MMIKIAMTIRLPDWALPLLLALSLMLAGPVIVQAEDVSALADAPRSGPVTRLPLPRFVSLKAKANVRRGPGTDHRIDWVFYHKGTPLQIVAEYDNWRRVLDADGTGGWIHRIFLDGTRTVVVRAPVTSIRESPDPDAPEKARAMQGVIARILECGEDWCRVSSDGYRGWVVKGDVWGVGESETVN